MVQKRFRPILPAVTVDTVRSLMPLIFISFYVFSFKPRPHQQQCRSNVIECYKSNDSLRCFELDFREISSFRQSRNKLNMFNLFRLCRKGEMSRKTRSTLMPTATISKQHSTLSKELFDFSIRQCCFDIVTGVDGSSGLRWRPFISNNSTVCTIV